MKGCEDIRDWLPYLKPSRIQKQKRRNKQWRRLVTDMYLSSGSWDERRKFRRCQRERDWEKAFPNERIRETKPFFVKEFFYRKQPLYRFFRENEGLSENELRSRFYRRVDGRSKQGWLVREWFEEIMNAGNRYSGRRHRR